MTFCMPPETPPAAVSSASTQETVLRGLATPTTLHKWWFEGAVSVLRPAGEDAEWEALEKEAFSPEELDEIAAYLLSSGQASA